MQFDKKYAQAEIEHSLVITPQGQVFEVKGVSATVNTLLVGEENLEGSIIIHNHPIRFPGDSFDDSFSKQDLTFAARYRCGKQYLVSGTMKHSFELLKECSEEEASQIYDVAKYNIYETAYKNNKPIEHEQYEIMCELYKISDKVVFNEDF